MWVIIYSLQPYLDDLKNGTFRARFVATEGAKQNSTLHGHKLRLFTLREAQFPGTARARWQHS
jgi:hypothetical protein